MIDSGMQKGQRHGGQTSLCTSIVYACAARTMSTLFSAAKA